MFGWLLTKTNSYDLLAAPLRFAFLILSTYSRFTLTPVPSPYNPQTLVLLLL
jgi:hypothetical protein